MRTYPVDIFLPAGFGERLRPATNHLPKPLLPILGTPIIEDPHATRGGLRRADRHQRALEGRAAARLGGRVALAGPHRVLSGNPILGTGGALKNAESLLSDRPFIVHNSDILLDIDFSRLIEEHLASGNVATLVCHRLPPPEQRRRRRAWPGAGRREPRGLEARPTWPRRSPTRGSPRTRRRSSRSFPGVSHATVAWVAASKAGHKVRALDVTGAYWNDVGDPATYARGVLDALRTAVRRSTARRPLAAAGWRSTAASSWSPAARSVTGRDSGTAFCSRAGWRRVATRTGSSGRTTRSRCPNRTCSRPATPPRKKRVPLSDPLFAPHFEVPGGTAGRTRAPGSPIWSDAILIGLGGSDRRYFRLQHAGPDRGADGMSSRRSRFRAAPRVHGILRAARRAGAGPPRRGRHEQARSSKISATPSLYAYLQLPHDARRIEDAYRDVLESLVAIHAVATEHVDSVRSSRRGSSTTTISGGKRPISSTASSSGFASARWTTVRRRHGASSSRAARRAVRPRHHPSRLPVSEHHDPRRRAADHRLPGRHAWPPAYDIASILWDPYHRLDDRVRERLLAYYLAEMSVRRPSFDEKTFREASSPAGSSGTCRRWAPTAFLAVVKGKTYFLKHVRRRSRCSGRISRAPQKFPELVRLTAAL